MNLFDGPDADNSSASAAGTPLAERMRPATFDEFVGQQDILAPGRPLREAIERDLLQSIILWGPPGTGKTTLARLIAKVTQAKRDQGSDGRGRAHPAYVPAPHHRFRR